MWLCTRHGFYSAVAGKPDKDGTPMMMIRARQRGHLENLLTLARVALVHSSEEILDWGDSDYRYRLIVTRDDWLEISDILAEDIDYGNFKNSVLPESGKRYVKALHSVWGVLGELQPGGPYGKRFGGGENFYEN